MELLKSILLRLAEFFFTIQVCRDRMQARLMGFFVSLLFFLESKTHQSNFKRCDYSNHNRDKIVAG